MAAYGLGAFTEGLQSGIETRRKSEFQKEYTELMRQKGAQGAIDLQETYDTRLAQWKKEGGDKEGFLKANPGLARYQQPGDPFIWKMGRKLGRFFGFGGEQEQALPARPVVNEERGATQAQSFSPPASTPYQGGMVEEYRHGGKVRRYADGGDVEDYDPEKDPTHIGDVTPSGEYGAEMRAWRRAGGALGSAWEGLKEAEGIRETARAGADVFGTGWMGLADIGTSTLKDVAYVPKEIIAGIADVDRYTGGDEAAVGPTGIDTGFRPTQSGGVEDLSVPADQEAAAGATAPAPTPDEQIAQQAIEDGKQNAMENINWAQASETGLTPDELAANSMTTQDWTDYRREMMDSMIARGSTPSEALKEVDYMTVEVQQRGFDRELQKVHRLLAIGHGRGAELALVAAYQYFPNGSRMKVASIEDPKTGQPALAIIGLDEETGEPKGKPWVLTADRVGALAEMASDPAAWRHWTKDNRQLQLDVAKYEETVAHHRATEEIAAHGATTDRMRAEASATGIDMDPEQRHRGIQFTVGLEKLGETEELFADPQIQSRLGALMSDLQDLYPSLPPNTISEQVLTNFREAEAREPGSGLRYIEAQVEVARKGE